MYVANAETRKARNAYTKQYRKTKSGFLTRAYNNAKDRVNGISGKCPERYKGLPIMDRAVFYEWANGDPEFHRLFAEWEQSGYDTKLSPSLNRIDHSDGYVIGNVNWLTHSENSRLGNLSRLPWWKRPKPTNADEARAAFEAFEADLAVA